MTVIAARDAEGQKAAALPSYLTRDISLNLADIPMLVCSFLSGLVDAVAFNAGAVFVSMQTGTYLLQCNPDSTSC
jgi:hypothetical protein